MGRRGAHMTLPHIQRFADRHGNIRVYYRNKGYRVALPASLGSPEFIEAYTAAHKAFTDKTGIQKKAGGGDGTIRRLVFEYYNSLQFRQLQPSTKKTYRSIFDRFCKEHGDRLVSQMRREHVVAIVNKAPNVNSFIRRLKTLIKFAISIGWIDTDPTLYVEGVKSVHHHTWTSDEIEQYQAHWPLGTMQRLAFDLHLYTAQRRSDVYRMTWRDIKDGAIFVTQKKTGEYLEIPIHPELAKSIAAIRKDHISILTTQRGKAFSCESYGNWMREAIRAAGLPDRCKIHGLRYSAATRSAEAGCTSHEIMSITGHRTTAQVDNYTRKANQKRLAKMAIEKQSGNR